MCRRLIAFFATFCLCLSTFSVAYADGNSSIGDNYSGGAQVHWYPFDIGGSSKEYCMVSPCSNQFMAALSAIGHLDKYPQLSNPQLALLSNDDTGGAFYDLAERFGSVAQYGYPSWSEGYYLWSISAWADFHTSVRYFGEDHVWYASGLNETMVTNATTDFFKVLNGEVTGGSGTGNFGNTLTFTTLDASPMYYVNGTQQTQVSSLAPYNKGMAYALNSSGTKKYYYCPFYAGSSGREAASSTFDIRVDDSFFDNVISLFDDTFDCCVVAWVYYSTFDAWYPVFWLATKSTVNNSVYNYTLNGESKSANCGRAFFGRGLSYNNDTRQYFRYSDALVDLQSLPQNWVLSNDFSNVTSSGSGSDTSTGTYVTAVAVFDKNGYIGAEPVIPPNNWPEPTPPQPQPEPDPPDVPDPPDLPGPPENPTIPEPDPPSPINPYTPIVEPEPTGTTPNDYTPWLRAILAALNRIIVDLANHCQHIQNAIRDASSYIVTAIGDYVEYLAGKLHYELTMIIADLESYLADLAQWLADELDFDRDSQVYDDARLMRVLLSIYSRLGDLDSAISDLSAQLGDIYVRLGQILNKIGSGGGGRPAPTTEPEVDEGFDFWQWLLDLISSKLDGIIDDFVGDIGGFLNELISTFPFSIPWDIAAYLTLLDAQRATPVISFVIPAIDGWWGEVPITVDLQPYDNAMAAVRSMMLILWGFWLLFKTDWLGGVFDGAAQAVTSFFDRLTGHGGGS